MTQRVGMFGGAFDPPHEAHVALAQAAVAQLQLDVLHVLPTGHAWHKTRPLSPAADRLAMTQLAFGDCPGVVVDDRELRRSGPTYTLDTLHALRADHPQAQLYLIVGADQALALPSWHRWADIPQLAIISVAFRADGAAETADLALECPVPGVAPGRCASLRLPAMPHSATDIRARVAAGEGIDHLVPPPVARYIEQHHLYLAA